MFLISITLIILISVQLSFKIMIQFSKKLTVSKYDFLSTPTLLQKKHFQEWLKVFSDNILLKNKFWWE